MMKKLSRVYSYLLMILCLSSLIYLTDVEAEESNNSPNASVQGLPSIREDNLISNPDALAETTNTSGTYKKVAYFTQDSYVDLDENGYVFEWEKYEDVKDDSINFDNVNFFLDNASSDPDLRWHPLDTYDQAQSADLVNGEYINSTVFTPEFSADTYIQGNVYFMCAGETWRSAYSNWTLKITLESFNPSTGQTNFITQASGEFDDTNEYTGWYRNSTSLDYQGMIYEGVIPSTTLIPAGHRLRAKYEAMLGSADYGDDSERFELRTGGLGGSTFYPTQWNIDATNNSYDEFYHIENSYESIGVQFYMYQEDYPTIDLTGLTNNTIYTESTNGTLTISSDSVLNRYKWDSDSFTNFNSPTIVSLPTTTGWHTLTTQAYDLFDNLAEATYTIGFDGSDTNVILHSPANNSLVDGGELLNFSIYDSTSVFYEWDKNTTLYPLTDPFDISTPLEFLGQHQLTIHYTDPFVTELYEYFFIFDNAPPDILLDNVVNGTTQPQGKNIDVIIDDQSYPIDVQYKWDSDSFASWTPFLGNLYRAYLPSTAGWHNLSVLANDTYGNSQVKVFSFNTSLSLLNVELYNLLNNSYYQGGNTVQISIANDNGTVKYFWGNDPWSDGTGLISSGIMTLGGGDALSSTPGTYILTVIVGNAVNDQIEFKFLFRVDQENPTIDQVIPTPDYNDSRFLVNARLSYDINDNWTDTSDLIIFYSIDNANNKTLDSPFYVYLSGLSDGSHNLTIIVYDIAGNYYRYYITFIIDTTRPDTDVIILEQAIVGGFKYIPADTLVTVIVTDADPDTDSYYRWNSTTYIPFVDNFNLPAIEGYAKLDIFANDSLGNYRVRTIWLTIDGTAPTIELILLMNHTKINDMPINFNVEDINDNTIAYIESKWDIEVSPIQRTPEFYVSLLIGHLSEIEAIIYLYTYDVVGNEYSCEYHFMLDFDAPNYLISTPSNSYLTGGQLINFTILDADISKFLYKWDYDETYLTLESPWDIIAPLQDGNYTLAIRLEDDAGLGIHENNFVEATFIFIIDDIELLYMNPSDFTDNYNHTMLYGENFTITVNITNRLTNDEVENLSFAIIKEDASLNLSVDVINVTNTEYIISIYGTNVTNNQLTGIEVRFWQFIGNNHSVSVNLKIDKLDGYIDILSTSETIIFGENFTMTLQLFDNLNYSSQEIIYISVDGNDQDILYTCIDEANLIYQITFNTRFFVEEEGEHSFTVHIEANFYSSTINSDVLQVEILSGLSLQWIITIIASAVLFSLVMGFVIYRVVRARPFEELMEKVSEEDIEKNMEKLSPGVVLSIFDQKKGPIPLVGNHSLESTFYTPRMRIGYENFLLKISDQAYSSLGFEEHDDRRRIGSINLPNEDMIGFIHGVQLPNPAMRGGFENLTLIVLADKEAGGLMLANQEFMFMEIDELITSLQGRAPLGIVEEHLKKIRRRSVIIMLAAQKNVKKDKKEVSKYQ
jgi:hypothetical protein